MVMVRSVKFGKKKVLIISGVVVLVIIAGAAAWFVIAQKTNSPLPRDFIESVNFPLYYPSPLPTDYVLDKQSVGSDGSVAHYDLLNKAEQLTITITLQATPSDFDAAKLIGSASIPTTIMPSGTLYNLSIGGMNKYMFTTGDGTLLFITSMKTIPEAAINTIARNLQKIK